MEQMNLSQIKIPGIASFKLPELAQVRQNLDEKSLKDPAEHLRAEILKSSLPRQLSAGDSVAVAVGSRGIDRLGLLVKTLVAVLKELGAEPFIVPAMGSHGGASAHGQRNVLADYGITPEHCGAPLRSSLETVDLGWLELDSPSRSLPLYFDREAYRADHVVVLNRVKVHTDFAGPVQSGLLKMLAVGLGNHRGAQALHGFDFSHFAELIPAAGQKILQQVPVRLGIALLENARDEIQEVRTLEPAEFLKAEREMLKKQQESMADLPFAEIDILLVNEIGKDISGSSMDTNIIGRAKPVDVSIEIIIPLAVSPRSHGNVSGLGFADLTTRRLVEEIDFNATYTNALTSGVVEGGKIPVTLPSGELALKTGLKLLNRDPEKVRLVRIQNTLQLDKLEVSRALLPEVENREELELCGEPRQLKADSEGRLLQYPY